MKPGTTIGRTSWLAAAILLATCTATLATDSSSPEPNPSPITITTTKLEVTDKTFEWCYRIINASDRDIWLCEDVGPPAYDFEVYVPEGRQDLMIRRRFDFGAGQRDEFQERGRYIRLRAGQSREESLLLPVPISRRPRFEHSSVRRDSLSVRHLVLEIGFYTGDLPEMILRACEASESEALARGKTYPAQMVDYVMSNDHTRDREVGIWTPRYRVTLPEGHILRLVADTPAIPYVGTPTQMARLPRLPEDLIWCTRVQLRFQPSMLEFFFPYPREQSLLNAAEIAHLKSQKTLDITRRERVRSLIDQIRRGYSGGVATPGPAARMTCFRNDEQLISLTLRGDTRVDTEDNQRLRWRGLYLLRRLTPQIQPYEMRIRCARNLRNLWYRLRLYQRILDTTPPKSPYTGNVTYPPITSWCQDLLRTCVLGQSLEHPREPFACPATGDTGCHYAMNPHCGPDSAGDVVLLFETKAGWNQHGGTELFAFDNHDPKGGCVLLNDGTVKFIRTPAELQALRWK